MQNANNYSSIFREGLAEYELFRLLLINMLDTAQMVEVVSVFDENNVDVKPLFKNTTADGDILPTEEAIRAKVIFPHFESFPIEIGSKGVLIALKFDTPNWDKDIEPTPLQSTRKYSFANSVFIPMTANKISDNFILTYHGNSITVKENEIDIETKQDEETLINVKATTVNIEATNVSLGGSENAVGIARIGDTVKQGDTVVGTIATGSEVVKSI